MTYNVFGGMLSLTQSINLNQIITPRPFTTLPYFSYSTLGMAAQLSSSVAVWINIVTLH